ncbi:CYTH and CHAD domain-containing protein [Actinotalea sp. Marseille-Q4924]|uniref:CYTH and CHAD domain-containing protein n=1 Tax=Actinotalea sp. Marseille-Q4924 TaxID=2866571 RepID=UPI001CE40955|nr:CYTH and CHAD domain-containing protein [Actinotalea sp. Marseille-Q4924]
MAATTQVEREIKLDVPDGVDLPALGGLPGVAEVRPEVIDHEAVYFDTADLRLLRNRITLRRRSGGPDEGWHLKRPLPDGDRSETRLPLGRSTRTVPAELRRQVQVHVRTGTLVPVATLRTRREVHRLVADDGTVLAEVADDAVDGTVGRADGAGSGWREWEVELVEGDDALLEAARERLLSAGAVPAQHASKVGRLLRSAMPDVAAVAADPSSGLPEGSAGDVVWRHVAQQVAALTALDPQVREDEPDAVHRMRVAARRLRSVLRTFRPVLDRAATDPLRDELEVLGEALARARDGEVLAARIGGLLAEQDVALVLGPAERRLQDGARDEHRRAQDAVVKHLGSDRYLRLLDDLDALLASPPWRPKARKKAASVLPRAVARVWRDAAARVEAVPDGDADVALHEARKGVRRVRYAAEAVAPTLGGKVARFAARVEAVQDALGEHQDSVVARTALRQIGIEAHLAGENAFTWGLLHGLERERAARARADFRRAWAKAARPKRTGWLA